MDVPASILAKTEPVIIPGLTNFNDVGDLHAPDNWEDYSANLCGYPDTEDADDLTVYLMAIKGIVKFGERIPDIEKKYCFKHYKQWAMNLLTAHDEYYAQIENE